VKLRVGFLVQDIPQKNVPGGQVLELLYFSFVIGQHPILQIGDDGVSPSRGGIQAEHLAIRSLNIGDSQ